MIRLRQIKVYCGPREIGNTDPPWPSGYNFGELTAEQLAACPMGREKDRAVEFRARLERGHRAVGFWDGLGEVVCYLWATRGQDGARIAPFEMGLKLQVSTDQFYIWDCRTDPRHRGRGLYRCGLMALLKYSHAESLKPYIVSRRENKSSCKAIESVGFIKLTDFYVLSIGRAIFISSGVFNNKLVFTGESIELPYVQSN